MDITIDMVLSENPCNWHTREELETLAAGRESVTPSEIAGLDVPIQDRLWILSRFVGRNDPTRIMARRIVRDALGDREIPDEYRVWLDSGNEDLRAAAWDAAGDVDRSAAWSAAWSAAGATDRSAAWFAADSAAEAKSAAKSTTRAAARAAAQERYLGWMVEYLENID